MPPGLVLDAALRRRRLRAWVLVELALTAVVLTVAVALVQNSPARTATSAPPHASRAASPAVTAATGTAPPPIGPYSAIITGRLAQLEVDIDPAAAGPNELHLFAATPTGAPLKVLEWRVTAALPGRGIEPIPASLLPVTDNHAIAQIELPSSGVWQFSITVRISVVDEETLTQKISVR